MDVHPGPYHRDHVADEYLSVSVLVCENGSLAYSFCLPVLPSVPYESGLDYSSRGRASGGRSAVLEDSTQAIY